MASVPEGGDRSFLRVISCQYSARRAAEMLLRLALQSLEVRYRLGQAAGCFGCATYRQPYFWLRPPSTARSWPVTKFEAFRK